MLLLLLISALIVTVDTETVYSAMIFRHGARTPITYFSEKMFPDQQAGELTQQGRLMMQRLGEDTYSYISGKGIVVDQDSIMMVSSPVNRTLVSADRYLKGFASISDYVIDFDHIYQIPNTNHFDQDANTIKKMTIYSLDRNNDYYFHAQDNCDSFDSEKKQFKKFIKQQLSNITQNKEFVDFVEQLNEVYLNSINKPIDVSTMKPKIMSKIRDLVISATFHDKQEMIPFVSDNIRRMLDIFKKQYIFDYKYKSSKTQKMVIYHSLKQLRTNLQNIKDNGLFLVSTHDSQLANWIGLFIPRNYIDKYPEIYQIPFASQIIFEVVRNDNQLYVELRMNNRLVPIRKCKKKCTLDKFMKLLASYLDKQKFKQLCSI